MIAIVVAFAATFILYKENACNEDSVDNNSLEEEQNQAFEHASGIVIKNPVEGKVVSL